MLEKAHCWSHGTFEMSLLLQWPLCGQGAYKLNQRSEEHLSFKKKKIRLVIP